MAATYRLVRSLRFRLTVWYTGALALVLAGAALLAYVGAGHALLAGTDAFLSAEARRLSVAARGTAGDAPDAADLAETVSDGSVGAVPRPGVGGLPVPVFDVTYLRIVARSTGRTLASSPELARQPALLAALDTPLRGATGFVFAGPDEERQMRVLSVPATAGTVPVWVQAAVPWDRNADTLERLGRLLATGVGVALAACAAGGWLLVGRTLQPIRRIALEAERLDADALPEALLPYPAETDSEIGQLVATLNRMTTRLHRAFAAQKRLGEAQQRFAADASHELRTPLTILRGEMEVALTRPRTPAAYQATLQSAVEEIDRMSRIVAGLSFLAQRDAGQVGGAVVPALVPTDITCLCHVIVDDFQARAREKDIVLCLHLDGEAVWAAGDAGQLRQLVGNLLDNALHYTEPGGTVTVAVERVPVEREGDGPGVKALLHVTDTGIGIAPQDLPYVFDRFWRADPARAAGGGGSGLGLAISAQITEAHGGTLSATSVLGQGSDFCLCLPLCPAPIGA